MSEKSSDFSFYRRCHVCDCVNGSDEPVLECLDCHKVMAPFFFFDVRRSKIYSDRPFDKVNVEGKYRPIEGLTAFW